MSEAITSDACYLCTEEARIQNLGSSFLVDCSRCGAYEIEALLTTVELKNPGALWDYLKKERGTGSLRPLIFRELLSRGIPAGTKLKGKL